MGRGDAGCATADRSAAGVDGAASGASGLDRLEAPPGAAASNAAVIVTRVIVDAVVGFRSSLDHPLGDALSEHALMVPVMLVPTLLRPGLDAGGMH